MKRCFFIGHREASIEILTALTEAVERHIAEFGVTEFIVGNYGGFDRMAIYHMPVTANYVHHIHNR